MAHAARGQPTLETIPTSAFEEILLNLSTDDLAATHVSSQELFHKCSEYILHGQIKSNWENTEVLRLTRLGCIDRQPESPTEEDIWKGYWDCISVQKRQQYPSYYCICLNIEKLNNYEIAQLISFYKGRMQYLLFEKKKSKYSYRPIVGIRLGYKILEKFYWKRDINYKLVFKTFRTLQFPSFRWKRSYADIQDEEREESLQEERRESLRRLASEITIRTRSLCLS